MEANIQKIEKFKIAYEESILSIDGVISLSIGLCENNQPCLQIGISVPADVVRPLLPKQLSEINIKLHYVGTVEAQKNPP